MNALRNVKRSYLKTSIEHVNDELLVEILCRLPSYRTAVGCKTVSKHWCSIISDPFFVAKGFSVRRGIRKQKGLWILFLTYKLMVESYILSLNFLPNNPFIVVNNFEDLILCFSYDRSIEVGVFIICNPLIKQWIALPPSQTHGYPFLWAGLVWPEGRDFRVIVLPSLPRDYLPFQGVPPFTNFNLDIYLSETGQWKNLDVEIPLRPYKHLSFGWFSVVVCKGMVCMHYDPYFGAFNPFDVTPGFCGTLRAIGLPLPTYEGKLLENCGKLIAVECSLRRRFHPNEKCWAYDTPSSKYSFKLDVNYENDEQHHTWKRVAKLPKDIKVPESIVAPHHYTLLNVDPNEMNVVYFMARLPKGKGEGEGQVEEYQLVVCNTRLQTFVLLKQAPAHQFFGFKELHLSYWPMPISKGN